MQVHISLIFESSSQKLYQYTAYEDTAHCYFSGLLAFDFSLELAHVFHHVE
jgi:hypothetical protein